MHAVLVSVTISDPESTTEVLRNQVVPRSVAFPAALSCRGCRSGYP
jgi:hypothetical protein